MCASTRANFWLRSVNPDLTDGFAVHHDAHVWLCLWRIIGSSGGLETAKDISSLLFLFEGLGVSRMRGSPWCSLGKLGRLHAHGEQEALRGGGNDAGRHGQGSSGMFPSCPQLSAVVRRR